MTAERESCSLDEATVRVATAAVDRWLAGYGDVTIARGRREELILSEVERLDGAAAEALSFAAPAGEAGPKGPAGWGRPVVEWMERVAGACANEKLSDEALLARLEEMAEELPGLIEEMDVDALAALMESGMGQAAVGGAIEGMGNGRRGISQKVTKETEEKEEASLAASDEPDLSIAFAPMAEAVAKLGRKTPVGAKLSSAEWARVPVALRERAQFSARVASVRFLYEVQDQMQKRIGLEKEKAAHGEAFVDRGSFIAHMREVAQEEGLDTTSDPAQRGTVRDIRSAKRLGLIYDMQERTAAEYTRWKMGQDADVLDAFPAWRFVRVVEVEQARDWHARFEGEVRLKTDIEFWTRVNEDFGVPWGPWGWGCGHDVEDVDRAEAEELGLLAPGDAVPPPENEPPGVNDDLGMSVAGVDERGLGWLQDAFGDQVEIRDGAARWKGNLIDDLAQRVEARGLDKPFDNQAFKGQTVRFGRAADALVEKGRRAGLELGGAEMILTPDNVYHILKRHGVGRETRSTQRPVSRLDLEMLPHVWRDPDAVENAKGQPRLTKEIAGRTVAVLWDKYRDKQWMPTSVRIERTGE